MIVSVCVCVATRDREERLERRAWNRDRAAERGTGTELQSVGQSSITQVLLVLLCEST